ncbi:MAG: Fic family protein [Armatimonadetes bacterium]|nr:Fic family protein [Armatimonadota bacterium]
MVLGAQTLIWSESARPFRCRRFVRSRRPRCLRRLLLRLQRLVVAPARFVRLGFRTEGGFVGRHDRDSGAPIPDHVSARPEDLPSLLEGLLALVSRTRDRDLEPVVAAASAAFAFVFVHPFEDGNGRVHRYLLQHVLSERGVGPPGLPLPLSPAILARLAEYHRVLERYSAAVLPLVEWRATPDGNVRVLNDTARLYRYFDATPQAEFVYECLEQVVTRDLPAEIDGLERHDRLRAHLQSRLDIPGRKLDLLIAFLRQNRGRLSRRARSGEFAPLTDEEVAEVEAAYADAFEGGSRLGGYPRSPGRGRRRSPAAR